MNLNDLLQNEVSQLSDELRDIDGKIRDAAQRGLSGTVSKLAQRKRELPSLIHSAKLRDITLQLNDQRSKILIFEMESDKAYQNAMALGSELPNRLTELEQEKQKLLNDVAQSQLDKDNLHFALQLETDEYRRLKKIRENLLLAHL
jgi:hypothetical protein